MESLIEIKLYEKYGYKYREGNTKYNINQVLIMCQPFIVTDFYTENYYDDGTFSKTAKFKIGVRVTFRTKSKHGPTVEFNTSFPKLYKMGEKIKIRCRGKLILI